MIVFLKPKSILSFQLWYEPNDFNSSCAFDFIFNRLKYIYIFFRTLH